MAAVSTTTKGNIGRKAAKSAIKHPRVLLVGARAGGRTGKLAIKVAKPLIKRRVRRRTGNLGAAMSTIGQTVAAYGPMLVYETGLVERPRPKRTAPRVAAGVVIGAGAMYFLEPGHGREHREQVAKLVG